MSVEASGGGASVGSCDSSGDNNGGHECRIGIHQIEESSDQRFSEQEKKLFDQNEESSEEEKKIEESSDQGFSEKEKKLFVSFEKALEAANKTDRSAGTNPKIQKVPSMLRDNNKLNKYFEPKVFSVGPYNRSLRTHKMAKQIKVNLVAKFLEQNDVKKEDLYRDIKKQIPKLKDCYDDELTNDYNDKDHKLAWMFLVDGCAILQFMFISIDFSTNPDTQLRKLGIKTDYAEFLVRDLLLLENQLPYQLLQLIIQHASKHQKTKEDRTSKEDKLLKSIYEFIFCYIRSLEWYWNDDEILKDLKNDPIHLLDLVRKMHIQPLNQIHKKHDFVEIIMGWIADLFYELRCDRSYRAPVQFPNIGKLKEAGINLKPSETSCVTDISFIRGTLKLPPIFLDELTASTFLNILGYEMCPDFHNDFEFISYMYFLDKLIDRTKDVDELREKNILRNQLGRDEEVAELFNEIGSHLFPNYEIYLDVKWSINKYFRNKGFMWLRKVTHDIHQYFKNRWSLLALIAALLALAASIIQTIYTVFGLSS